MCQGQSEVNVVFVEHPSLITIRIYHKYSASTMLSVEITVPVNGSLLHYQLFAVVYNTGNYFFSRLMLCKGMFDYDRQVEGGRLCPVYSQGICNLVKCGVVHIALYVPA